PTREILPECFGIARLLLVVHLLVNRCVEGVEGALPVDPSNEIWISLETAGDSAQHGYVEFDLLMYPGTLNFQSYDLTGAKACAMHLSQACRRNGFVLEAFKDFIDLRVKLSFNNCSCLSGGKRRHLILQLAQFLDVFNRQQIRASC